MKHIWIFNHYAQEPSGSGGMRHFHIARYLKQYDWEATIIASSISHRNGQQRIKDNSKFLSEVIEGVNYVWVKTSPYFGNKGGRIKNMLEYTLNCLAIDKFLYQSRPHMVVGSSVHPLAGIVAWRIAKKFKIPFIFEVRDLWPQTLIDMGRLDKNGIRAKALRFLEKFLYKKADLIVTLLPYADEYIGRMGIASEKILWISNGTDISPEEAPPPIPENKSSRPLELMYFGAHGEANGLDTLIQAMSIVKNRSTCPTHPIAKLTLIGEGLKKRSLEQESKDLGLDSNIVQFMPAISKKEIPSVAAQADAFVITVRNLPDLYRYGISTNKLFDYMAAARPVVIASAARNNPIADCHGGISVEPENPEALADAICALASMRTDELNHMGQANRQHVALNYSYRKLTETLANKINELHQQHNQRQPARN